MSEINDWFKKLPAETQSLLNVIWQSIPPSERQSFLSLITAIPDNTTMMRSLVRLSTEQFQIAFGKKQKVAIVGPANVGKSTLFNQFISNKDDHSEVSPIPGTTRVNIGADTGIFSLVDTPGADAVGEVGEKERDEALSAAESADFLIIMFDAIQGVKQTELELYQRLTALNKPFIVVLNKVDLIKRQLKDVVAITARNLGLREEQIIPVSATRGSGIDEVLLAIASADPGMIVALAKALPQYRWQLAWKTIVSGASASAVIALTPLPIIDFVPLLAIQTSMVLAIARFYQYKITLARARELVITFGIAFIGRTLFYELSKFGGIPGWMLAAAIASSTTVAMGYAAAAWFSKGERLSDEALKNITKRTTDMILNRLKSIGKKKPQGQSLKNEISEILADPHTDEIVISEDHAQDRAAGNQEPLQAPSNPPHIAEDQ